MIALRISGPKRMKITRRITSATTMQSFALTRHARSIVNGSAMQHRRGKLSRTRVNSFARNAATPRRLLLAGAGFDEHD